MHSAMTHHLLTDAQPVPEQQSQSPGQQPPVYIPSITSYCMEYPFGQFVSAVMAMLPPSFLCTSFLAEHGKLQSPWLSVSTAQQQLKHQCIINIMLILNPKHSTIPATRKKINSVPAENKTVTNTMFGTNPNHSTTGLLWRTLIPSQPGPVQQDS